MTKQIKIYPVAVIGAGASGMTAAITAARNGSRVLLLDKNPKAGVKLALTGNGRGNLTNEKMNSSFYHRTDNRSDLIETVFSCFSTSDTVSFMESLGIHTTSDEGWVYPRSYQASAVVAAMEEELLRLSVTCKYNLAVTGVAVNKELHCFEIITDGWSYYADKVILACGSKAHTCAKEGPYGYELAESLGHTILPVKPALTGLRTENSSYQQLSGVRVHGKISVLIESEENHTANSIASETGELQFTSYGISGIPTFCICHEAQEQLTKGKVLLSIDFLPEEKASELIKKAVLKTPSVTILRFLNGILPFKVCDLLLKKAKIKPGTRLESLEEVDINLLCLLIHDFRSFCIGTLDFDHAQVCLGGVATDEIDPATMESTILPGLYITGELLNVDGKCGGYNLQWAFSTGAIAGRYAAN